MALSGEAKRAANARAYAKRKLRRALTDPARAIARWASLTLRVPTGRLAGQPFKLESWQVDFLRGALGSAHSAALSLPRKLGKTSLIAIVLLAFLVPGAPLFRERFRGLVDLSGWWPGSGAEATRRRDYRGKRYRGRGGQAVARTGQNRRA